MKGHFIIQLLNIYTSFALPVKSMLPLSKWTSALKFYGIDPALVNLQDDKGDKLLKQQTIRGLCRRLRGKRVIKAKNPNLWLFPLPPIKPPPTKHTKFKALLYSRWWNTQGVRTSMDNTRSETCISLYSLIWDKSPLSVAEIFNVKRWQQRTLSYGHLNVHLVLLTLPWSSRSVDFSEISFIDINIHKQITSGSCISVYSS